MRPEPDIREDPIIAERQRIATARQAHGACTPDRRKAKLEEVAGVLRYLSKTMSRDARVRIEDVITRKTAEEKSDGR